MSVIWKPKYTCPRTHYEFDDKEEYVEHLRVQAREAFRDEEQHPRLARLQCKFDELRTSARSFDDIRQWLEAHARWLDDLMNRYYNLNIFRFDQAPVISEMVFSVQNYTSISNQQGLSPIRGVPNFYNEPDKPTSYPGVTGKLQYDMNRTNYLWPILSGRASIHTQGASHSYSTDINSAYFTMFGEDWPFVGARLLFDTRHTDLTEEYLRIIRYAFPAMSEEEYLTLHSAGLLPDTEEEFATFILSYTDPNYLPVPVRSPALPDDIVLDIVR